MRLDKNTFGDSKAAETLAKILDEEPHLVRPIGKIYADFCRGLRQIQTGIKDNKLKSRLLAMWTDFFLNDAQKRFADSKCKTFLLNLMQTQLKKARKIC